MEIQQIILEAISNKNSQLLDELAVELTAQRDKTAQQIKQVKDIITRGQQRISYLNGQIDLIQAILGSLDNPGTD